jgi:glycosyltransferase involved in cell wall biosynthesis
MLFHLTNDTTPEDRPWNLYIADNGGDEDSKDVIEAFSKDGWVDSVFFNENIGYSAACNQLASAGDSPYLALLNSDIWMTTQQCMKVIEPMVEDNSIAAIGPKQINERSEIVHAGIIGTNERPKHRGWKVSDPKDELFKDVIDCVTISGSAYYVRRSIWDELGQCSKYKEVVNEIAGEEYPFYGPFLPTPHYYEETFFSYHSTAHAYRVVYNGEVTIGHSWHASSPVGGHADQQFKVSQRIFRKACDFHGILRD